MSELAGERLEKGSVFRKIMVAAGNEHARFMFNISRAAFLVALADYSEKERDSEAQRIGREITAMRIRTPLNTTCSALHLVS